MSARTFSAIDYPRLERDIRAHGGATIALDGSIPAAGYAVSLSGHEERIPLVTFQAWDLYWYVIDNGRVLRDPGAHIGAWVDGSDVVLDLTHIVDDRATAEVLARANHQDAIFNLSTQEEINTREEVS